MSELLDQIKKNFESARQRQGTVKSEIQNLINSLAKKRGEQDTAILEVKPTETLEAEIVSLQTKLEGTKRALEKQNQILKDIQTAEAKEANRIAIVQYEKCELECMQLSAEIYSLISRCFPRIAELRIKTAEYISAYKQVNPGEVISKGRMMNTLILALDQELPKILTVFPSSIYADGNLPTPQSLKASSRK